MTEYTSLPVAGYRPQNLTVIDLVHGNKMDEEQVLRVLDELVKLPEIDKRWLAIGRTDLEKGFMAINLAIFNPNRVALRQDQRAQVSPCAS